LPSPHAPPPLKPTRIQWQSESWRSANAASPMSVIVIGTSFMFSEESVPRSSRLSYGTAEDVAGSEGRRLQFVPLGEKDFTGALTCCSVVPHCPNRVALGINGSVVLTKWHPTERDFVVEASVAVGFILVGIKPYFEMQNIPETTVTEGSTLPNSLPGVGLLLVSDWRHSVCLLKVNAIDGGLEVCARDSLVRGVMDAHFVAKVSDEPATWTQSIENGPAMLRHEVLLADESMNLSVLQQSIKTIQETQARAPRHIADDEEEAAENEQGAGLTPPPPSGVTPKVPAKVVAEKHLDAVFSIHVGDRVTSMARGSLTPCSTGSSVVEVIPGATGERFVFGTVHGRVGLLTQISTVASRFFELLGHFSQRARLAEFSRLVAPHCLRIDEFYDVLTSESMQLRSVNRRTSVAPTERRLKRSREEGNAPELTPTRVVDDISTLRGFVHVSDILCFSNLAEELRIEVVTNTNSVLLADVARGQFGFPAKPTNASTKPAGGSTETANDAPPEPSEAEVDEANDVLRGLGLPTLPLTTVDVDTVVQLVSLAHE